MWLKNIENIFNHYNTSNTMGYYRKLLLEFVMGILLKSILPKSGM